MNTAGRKRSEKEITEKCLNEYKGKLQNCNRKFFAFIDHEKLTYIPNGLIRLLSSVLRVCYAMHYNFILPEYYYEKGKFKLHTYKRLNLNFSC